jgi:hypothetical protein
LFESYTPFDFGVLIIGVLMALLLMLFYSKFPMTITIFGWIGETIAAYWAIFTTPLGIDGRASATDIYFNIIPSTAGALGLNFTIIFALIIMGSAFNFSSEKSSSSEHSLITLISALISLIIYFVFMISLPESLIASYIVISFCGSMVLLFIGLDFKNISLLLIGHKQKIEQNARSESVSQSGKVIIRNLILFSLIWLCGTISLILAILSFTARLSIQSSLQEILYLLLNCAIGIGILIGIKIWIYKKDSPKIRAFIFPIGIIMALIEYWAMFNTNSPIIFDPIIGIALIFITSGYIQIEPVLNRYNARGIWILLAWLIAAYTAYIPLRETEFQSQKTWIIPIIFCILILAFVCNYLLLIEPQNQEKHHKTDSGATI